MKKISIIIPAYNEEQRIKRTLQAYISYFDSYFAKVLKDRHLNEKYIIDYEIVVVLNGCTDNTIDIVKEMQNQYPQCLYLDVKQAGKGLAIQKGFLDALTRHNDLIGFVDADMATSPQAYYDLVAYIDQADGIIGSRYTQGAKIFPPRPVIKRWGSKLIYEPLVRLMLGLRYKDLQCGAKIFKQDVIAIIGPQMRMTQWAFDAEILYLCKKAGFVIKEYPTEWYDQAGSKIRYSSGIRMLASIILLRLRNSIFKFLFS